MYLLAVAIPLLMRFFDVAAFSRYHSGSTFVRLRVDHIAPREGVPQEQDNSLIFAIDDMIY